MSVRRLRSSLLAPVTIEKSFLQSLDHIPLSLKWSYSISKSYLKNFVILQEEKYSSLLEFMGITRDGRGENTII